LAGTLLGGFADDLFNTLFRLAPMKMKGRGFDWETAGRSCFTQDYGVLETITKIEPAENACSKARTTTMVRRKPGAPPLLFRQPFRPKSDAEYALALPGSSFRVGDAVRNGI
jgi:hypothetical protein